MNMIGVNLKILYHFIRSSSPPIRTFPKNHNSKKDFKILSRIFIDALLCFTLLNTLVIFLTKKNKKSKLTILTASLISHTNNAFDSFNNYCKIKQFFFD